MLDRLAHRLEVRTAEIRGNGVAAPPDDGDIEAAPQEALESPPDASQSFGPPPSDHTPAWGRLAELSARFDAASPIVQEPLFDADADVADVVSDVEADVVPDVEADDVSDGDTDAADPHGEVDDENELFVPHDDLGKLETDGETDAPETSGEPLGEDLGAPDGPPHAPPAEPSVDGDGEPSGQGAGGGEAGEHVDPAPNDPAPNDGVGSTEMVLSMAAERLTAPPVAGAGDAAGDESAAPSATAIVDVEIGEPGFDADEPWQQTDDEGLDVHDPDEADAAIPTGDDPTPDWIGREVDNPEAADPVPLSPPATVAHEGPATPYFDPTFTALRSAPAEDHAVHAVGTDLSDHDEVRHGPRWYRRRIKQFGIVAGLVPMVVLGAAAALTLAVGSGPWSGRLGLWLGTSAAPGLLIAGAPFGSVNSYPYAAVASIPFWLLLGWVARRRTLRRPIADWRDYWAQLTWLALAVTAGAAVALAIAAIRIGGPLLT